MRKREAEAKQALQKREGIVQKIEAQHEREELRMRLMLELARLEIEACRALFISRDVQKKFLRSKAPKLPSFRDGQDKLGSYL